MVRVMSNSKCNNKNQPLKIIKTEKKGKTTTIFTMEDGSKFATIKPRGISKMFAINSYHRGFKKCREGVLKAIESKIIEVEQRTSIDEIVQLVDELKDLIKSIKKINPEDLKDGKDS